MKQTLLTFLLLFVPLLVSADAVEIDGIYYNLVSKVNSAEVARNPNNYSGNIKIPEKVKYEGTEYSVTSIGEMAFFYNYYLTSITIPSSVTSIGDVAFMQCTGLRSVYISDLESWCKIIFSGFNSNPLFYAHRLFINGEEIKDLAIPNSVTSIENNSFSGFSGLTSITIPNNVTSIGGYAFYKCSGLTSITITNNVTSIGSHAFSSCTGLTSITIPNSVKSIELMAFEGCSGLSSITLGSGIETIRRSAFASCPELTDVYCYAEKVPNTDSDAFKDSYVEYATLHVLGASVNDYKAKSPWNMFKEIVAIEGMEKTHLLTYMVDGETYKTIEVKEGETIIPEEEPTKEGYTFSGWSEIPETMPDHDVIITGSFTINKYKLIYKVDDEEYKSYDIEYNSVLTPEEEPTKEGYTFSGWSEIPETMPANDVTITGTFTINKYKLIYMVDGEEYKSYDIEYNSTITPEEEPIKEGYTFSGWSEIPETMPAYDVTITGSFERVYSGGDVANLIDILLIGNIGDDDIALYDMNGDGELNIGDLILIIRAVNNSNNRSAANRATTGSQNFGFDADNITMKPGETTALNISLSNSANGIYGLQFEVSLPEGFSLEKDGYDKVYEFSTNQSDDITCSNLELGNGVYRFFIYSSTLQELKGGGLMSINLKVDGAQTLGYYSVNIDNIALSDYDGNVTKENGVSAGVKVTDFFTLLYKIDGEDYKSYEIEYGETITPEAEPTKEGYTFSGWSYIPSTMPAENVTVTGTFAVNKYTLTYMVDGEVYKTYEIEYGAAITLEAEPTKEGYTFSGWSEIPETMPSEDVTITGTFTINKYMLTYYVDGEVYESYEVEYGATITPEAEPTKEGYTFSGWSWIPETMPAKDVMIAGEFYINLYKLTYMIDDDIYKEVTYEYGATITPEPQPEGNYETFEWTDLPQTMPAHDVVVHANYTTGIIEVLMSSQRNVRIYSPNGKKLNKLQKGLNIVIYDDGTVHKIWI